MGSGIENQALEQVLGVVDSALRAHFPDDFDARCMYAAFGVRDRLAALGQSATIVTGDVLCLSASRSCAAPMLEGFGTQDGTAPSHFWVEAAGRRLDLGPHYLARRSRLDALPSPPVAWGLDVPQPLYLRYRVRERHPEFELPSNDPLAKRLAGFSADCARRAEEVPTPSWTWLLRSPGSVRAAARAGDTWARTALLFEARVDRSHLPF
jgi:hypothetical protein